MSHWLRRVGHKVTVLTSNSHGSLPDDPPWTRRSFDLATMSALRTATGRPSLESARASGAVEKPAPRLFTDVFVPDEHLLTWVVGALPLARRLVREREIECVITTGPPHSTHLLAVMLGRRRPAWIADFRDGWRFEPLRSTWPTSAQDRLDQRLERLVTATADELIGVTRPIAEDFADRLGARSTYVPNGWNPDLDQRVAHADHPALDAGYVNVVHTGKLSGHRGRDPAPLFAALDRLRRDRPELGARLRIVLAGRLDTEEQRLVGELDDSGAVVHVGHLDRDSAAALQRGGDALLLVTSPGHVSQATGKLFEYLTAGRPIIALAANNEAARIVRETGTGITVAPDDVDGIERALASAADGSLKAAYAPRGLEAYVYPRPAEQVAELVETAIAGRRGRG